MIENTTGRTILGRYVYVKMPGHPRATADQKYVAEHVLVAEKALGRYIDKRHHVHHVDGNRLNNAPSNLVICEDNAYHSLLHHRERVQKAGGNPNTEKICSLCKQLKNKSEFVKSSIRTDRYSNKCKQCDRERVARRRAAMSPEEMKEYIQKQVVGKRKRRIAKRKE